MSKFETAYRRKNGLMTKVYKRASEECDGHRFRLIRPRGLGQWEKQRRGKNNPEARDSGDMGFTYGVELFTTAVKPIVGITSEAFYWVTNKMEYPSKQQLKVPTFDGREVDMAASMDFCRFKMATCGWGREHAARIIQIALINMDDIWPEEILLTKPTQDPRQVHASVQRLITQGPLGGWQPFEVTALHVRSKPFTEYMVQRMLWIKEQQYKKRR